MGSKKTVQLFFVFFFLIILQLSIGFVHASNESPVIELSVVNENGAPLEDVDVQVVFTLDDITGSLKTYHTDSSGKVIIKFSPDNVDYYWPRKGSLTLRDLRRARFYIALFKKGYQNVYFLKDPLSRILWSWTDFEGYRVNATITMKKLGKPKIYQNGIFVIRYYDKFEELKIPYLVKQLKEDYEEIIRLLNITVKMDNITFQFVHGCLGCLPAAGFKTIYYPSHYSMFLNIKGRLRNIPHELTHILNNLMRVNSSEWAYPWMEEGIATIIGYLINFRHMGWSYEKTLKWLAYSDFIPIYDSYYLYHSRLGGSYLPWSKMLAMIAIENGGIDFLRNLYREYVDSLKDPVLREYLFTDYATIYLLSKVVGKDLTERFINEFNFDRNVILTQKKLFLKIRELYNAINQSFSQGRIQGAMEAKQLTRYIYTKVAIAGAKIRDLAEKRSTDFSEALTYYQEASDLIDKALNFTNMCQIKVEWVNPTTFLQMYVRVNDEVFPITPSPVIQKMVPCAKANITAFHEESDMVRLFSIVFNETIESRNLSLSLNKDVLILLKADYGFKTVIHRLNGSSRDFIVYYRPGPVTIKTNPIVQISPNTQLVFLRWESSIDIPEIARRKNEIVVNITYPGATITAVYQTQYKITIVSNMETLSQEIWKSKYDVVKLSFPKIVYLEENKTRAVFNKLSDSGLGEIKDNNLAMIVKRPETIYADYRIEHYVDIISNVTLGISSGWYENGTLLRIEAPLTVKDPKNGQLIFKGFSGDYNESRNSLELYVIKPLTIINIITIICTTKIIFCLRTIQVPYYMV